MPDSPGDITQFLASIHFGGSRALPELIPQLYSELRRLAAHCLRDERAGHTLQPTALVHEAYLKLADQHRSEWHNRAQFMALAAQLMRRILVDYARQRLAEKRGGGAVAVELQDHLVEGQAAQSEEMLAVDEALARLGELDAQQAKVVELRYFGGLTVEETADALDISPRTVKREWAMARAWLSLELASKVSR
jgi:RNA polymerase sigma-70 factor, ECF subfamily